VDVIRLPWQAVAAELIINPAPLAVRLCITLPGVGSTFCLIVIENQVHNVMVNLWVVVFITCARQRLQL
jgi:hypothetical protein